MASLERAIHGLKYRPDGFEALSYNYFLSQFAVGMIGIFGAVFVYQLGGTWYWGVIGMMAYYIGQRMVTLLVLPTVAELLGKWGYRRIMTLSLLSLIGRVVLLMNTDVNHLGWLVPAAMLGGVYLAGYHMAFHGMFLDDNDNGRLGEQIGLLELLRRLSLVVSPFVAGLLVEQAGFSVMFGVTGLILMVSLVPLFGMPHHKHQMRGFSMKKVMEVLDKHPHFTPAVYFWSMAQAITDFMWPVYLLTLVGHYSVLGAFSSVVMIVSSISVYGMGMVYDKRPLRHLFPAASLLVGVTWVLRFMALEPLTVLAADAGGRFLSPLWWMKIRRFGLNFGERINTLVFSVAYELLWTVGLMTGLFLGGMLVLMSGGVWAFVLVPAVGGVLLSAWAARNK